MDLAFVMHTIYAIKICVDVIILYLCGDDKKALMCKAAHIYIYADTHLTVSAHGLSLSVWIQFILLCAASYEVWDDSFRAARLDRVKLTAELLLA